VSLGWVHSQSLAQSHLHHTHTHTHSHSQPHSHPQHLAACNRVPRLPLDMWPNPLTDETFVKNWKEPSVFEFTRESRGGALSSAPLCCVCCSPSPCGSACCGVVCRGAAAHLAHVKTQVSEYHDWGLMCSSVYMNCLWVRFYVTGSPVPYVNHCAGNAEPDMRCTVPSRHAGDVRYVRRILDFAAPWSKYMRTLGVEYLVDSQKPLPDEITVCVYICVHCPFCALSCLLCKTCDRL
jgi:hypothetical protein